MSQEQGSKIKWGILGAARINRRWIPGAQAASNAEIVAVASRDADKGRELADKWNIPTLYRSYEELLADPQIQAVYIPLPNGLHVEWAVKAAQAGKHVLCEKPLALTVEDVRQVEEAAQASGVNVMEGFMYRFHPQQARVRELLAQGVIGQPKVLRATCSFVIAPGPNVRLDKELGGGATWDVGVYGINVARWMFEAEPQNVIATATVENGIDVNTVSILDFGDDRRAVLDYGIKYGRRSFYEIMGDKGTISVENMWQEADTPATLYLRTNDKGLQTEEFAPVSHFRLEVEAFGNAILSGQPSPYPLSDTAANTQVCLDVLARIAAEQMTD